MLRISIDGATRRNGKPNCVAAGGVFIQHIEDGMTVMTNTRSNYEHASTNQRGELLALLTALDYVHAAKQEAHIITDSEYLFNAMTKNWCDRWVHSNWKTAAGEPVKNADLWFAIYQAVSKCEEVSFYHIKGHVIPFGRVTADNLLEADQTGLGLYNEAYKKFGTVAPTKAKVIEAAQELSVKNNGFRLNDNLFREFVVANVVADAIATKVVDAADRNI